MKNNELQPAEETLAGFQQNFSRKADCFVSSPGRANIIGEHTDYADGFVFPIAINQRIEVLAAANGTKQFNVFSRHKDELKSFRLDKTIVKSKSWIDYVKGVVKELIKSGYAVDQGLDIYIGGDLTLGGGLSSSAALEMAISETCAVMFGFSPLGEVEQSKLCRKAENGFVGVSCGIMDQFAVRAGKKNHAILLDCRSLEYEQVPIPTDSATFVIVDSATERDLANTAYADRQKQAKRGAVYFKSLNKSLRNLRDVREGLLIASRDALDPVIYRRCRHVITENQRVLDAVNALKKPDIQTFGQLMSLSHESLKNDFEVSSPELDTLVDLARAVPGVLGARMTGAGFGGCTINLVMRNRIEEFCHKVGIPYAKKTGLEPRFIVTDPEDGLRSVKY